MRKPVIAANWKMHKTFAQGKEYIERFRGSLPDTDCDLIICPPYTLLREVAQGLLGTAVMTGAQNMHPQVRGAYTGEISADMILDSGATCVLVGHSERRQHFAETDVTVREKLIRCLTCGLTPILCIGETLEQKEAGQTEEVLRGQLKGACRSIDPEQAETMIIAYEPVWAIGTGKTASAQDAQDTIAYVRALVQEVFTEEGALSIRILYGGSVKPDNIAELMKMPDIDGVLVGGASLEPGDFISLIRKGSYL